MKIKKIKRRLAVLLCVCLLAGSTPAAVMADVQDFLVVGGTNLSADGYWTTTAEGRLVSSTENDPWNVSYDHSEKKLTLRDATIKGTSGTVADASSYNGAGIHANGNLTIEVSNTSSTSKSTVTGVVKALGGSAGISCGGVLTIQTPSADTSADSGKLEVFSDPASTAGSGVSSIGDMSISGNIELTTTGYASGNATGITSSSKLFIAGNAKVTATANEATASTGIRASTSIDISGSANVKAESLGSTGGTDAGSFGMRLTATSPDLENIIKISTSGTVDAIAGDFSNGNSRGLDARVVQISSGTVNATGGAAANSYGIYGTEDITISNSTITASGASQAMNRAPGLGNFTAAVVTASRNSSGSSPETYSPDQIANYKYLHITKGTAPAIVTKPEDLTTASIGELYSFQLEAEDNLLPITWSLSSGSLPSGLTLYPATGLISGTPTVSGSHSFSVSATNAAGECNPVDLELEVYQAPDFTLHPENQKVKEGKTATFTVNVNGYPTPVLQWQVSEDNGKSWTNILGATDKRYEVSSATFDQNGFQYRCVAKNDATEEDFRSEEAILTVEAQAVTIELPFNKEVLQGGDIAPTAETFQLQVHIPEGASMDIEGNTIATNGVESYSGILTLTTTLTDFYRYFADGIYISEKNGEAPHWTYDDAVWVATVEVNQDGQVINYSVRPYDNTIDPGEIMTFINTYTHNFGQDQDSSSNDEKSSKSQTTSDASAETGDTSIPIWILALALLASAAAMLKLLVERRAGRR